RGLFFFFSSRRRHTRSKRDWSSDVCSSNLSSRLREVVPRHGLECLIGGQHVVDEPEPFRVARGVRGRLQGAAVAPRFPLSFLGAPHGSRRLRTRDVLAPPIFAG